MEGSLWTDLIVLEKEKFASGDSKVQAIKYEVKKEELHEDLQIFQKNEHEYREKVRVLCENEKKFLEKVHSPQESVPSILVTHIDTSEGQVSQENVWNFEEKSHVIQDRTQRVRNAVKTFEEVEEEEAEDQEPCAASSLGYCRACALGPRCCVDLDYHDQGDINTDSSSLVPAAAAAGDLDHSHDDSEEESVISFYIATDDREGSLVEYEFFVNDDDADELTASRCSNEDGFNDGCDDEDGDDARYEGEEYENDYEEEYSVDDEGEEYYLEDEDTSHSQGSGGENFSRYQGPLEVILEILGEEGEDEGKEQEAGGDKRENVCDNTQVNTEDDLMIFSSSGEFSPDSIEERVPPEDNSKTEISIERTSSSDNHKSHQTLLERNKKVEYEATESNYAKTYSCGAISTICSQTLSTDNSSDPPLNSLRHVASPVGQTVSTDNSSDPPLNSLRHDASAVGHSTSCSPSYSVKEEESDRDKLKSLTSEIEAYLKETTLLLESATSYTSKMASSSTRSDELSERQARKTFTSTVKEPRVRDSPSLTTRPSHILGTSQTSGSSLTKNVSEMDSSIHTQNEPSCPTTLVQERQTIRPEPMNSLPLKNEPLNSLTEDKESITDSSTLINDISTPVKVIYTHPSVDNRNDTLQAPRQPSGKENGIPSTDNIHRTYVASVKENIVGSLTPKKETEILGQNEGSTLDTSRLCTESTDIYQSIMDTSNVAESEYFSAIETSSEPMEALDWDKKTSLKKRKKPERLIYQPPERTQDDDNYFTSPTNIRKGWLAAFEELEDSLDAVIKDDRPVFELVVQTPDSEVESTGTAGAPSSSHDQEAVGRLTPSRCDSPPPTVSCLENLERLCNRLSQEHERVTEGMCQAERLSPDGMEGDNCEGEITRRPTAVDKEETLMSIPSGSSVTEEKNMNSKRKSRPMMGVQHLQNHTAKTKRQTEFIFNVEDWTSDTNVAQEISSISSTRSSSREIGQSLLMEENVRRLPDSQGETSGTSKLQYIDTKLDEIFSCVENNVSVDFVPEADAPPKSNPVATNSLTPAAEDLDVGNDNVPSRHTRHQEEENDIQVQLNNILDGLDVMYEKYLEKLINIGEKQSLHKTINKQEFLVNEGFCTEEKEDSYTKENTTDLLQSEESRSIKSSCENTAFQDIIDISEDLKHLCVFHVNKPAQRDSPEPTTITIRQEKLEEAFPKFTDSDGATPEAKNCSKSGPISQHMAYHQLSSQRQSTRDNQTQNYEFLKRSDLSEGAGEPGGDRTDVVNFLVTLREENLRCYDVTVRCLENIVSWAHSRCGNAGNPQDSLHSKEDPLLYTDPKNMSALQLVAESRDFLMWCPDQDFDDAVSTLDIRGLVELVQTLQDAMAVEQQTFDSLSQQLELIHDPLQQQRLSAALCTSQTRLARLCSRNMRCFRQQALKARQKETPESRSSSPRDSGLVTSSAAASDAEGEPRSPTGVSFKNSLAFFQRAAHLVANNAKNTRARQKEVKRRSSRGSSCYGSSSSEAWSLTSDDPAGDVLSGLGAAAAAAAAAGAADEVVAGGGYEDDLAKFEDQGTYEQVLFINGRPQYQENESSSGERSRSGSWTRVRIDGSSGGSSGGGGGGGGGSQAAVQGPALQPQSVTHTYSSLPRRSAAASAHAAAAAVVSADDVTTAAQTQTQDLSSYVTLPRRKPYLNFKSVSSAFSNNSGSSDNNENLGCIEQRAGVYKNSGVNTITRTQSFKEGLNCYSNEYSSNASGLSRAQSFHDGLARDFNELESGKQKLQRAPSVDEILESVKSLRAKTMVKSTPDLSVQEPVYHSASLPRHKGSKGKAPRPPGTSSLLGVRYNGPSNDPQYERVPDPDYEQIPETANHYENVCKGNNHYENIHLQGEVIYDSPRPMDHHHYDKVHNDLHYENVKYDVPVYENVDENEPTYMNVNGTSEKANVYANLETNKKSRSIRSSKARANKVTISGSSLIDGTTYDVPRAATHIYDSPQKQVRSVGSPSEYDTPKNNRSVLPQSTQIILKAKSDQRQKIDDIFAECDQDSLEGDREREPDIPSPDYDSEEEGDGYEDASNEYVTSEFPDEGLGESDSRSYYAEDPAGLEVILEEPEEEYCSSHTSEDDLRREVDITYGLKGERRSLDGSEGIGSAEGDTHSSGGSEHYGEEDCASSGIHSEDTPSPGPPVDSEKDDANHHAHAHHRHAHQDERQKQEEDRTQQDRCLEVYPETVRQRQRNMMASPNKVDIKNWSSSSPGNHCDSQTSPAKVKKFLPSVKALRNQFESGKTSLKSDSNGNVNGSSTSSLSRKSSNSTSSLASSTLEKTSSTNSLSSTCSSMENLLSPSPLDNRRQVEPEEPVEPIYNQFKKVDEELRELMSRPPSTTGWNPRPLLKRLYYIPEAPKIQSQGTTYINIEGYLEKLPSGRKKATFWNAWKRRYFVAKDGVLYYYQNNQAEKPSMKMPLMGGKVECMEANMVGVDDGSRDSKASAMLGIDDGKGHYVVVRCSTRQEAERWRRALETHTVEDFSSQYVQPWPIPTNPALLRDILVIDLGSASIRAGVLASQATLPQVFLPSVVATDRESRRQVWGFDGLSPDVRASSCVTFPIRPSHKISKYSVDLSAVSSLLQKTFASLKVDPKNYHVQLSVPRVLNTNTQTELLRVLFDKYRVRSVNLTHQSILALYAYNATSGIIVDIGERMDIVPVIDGYIVDGGVSRVPYGGYRILDHLRQFLYMRNVSLINEVESYIIRYVLENICYCAHHYNTEKARCTNNSDSYEKSVTLAEYFHGKDCPYESVSLDFGRFQATEGLFNPDAWGLDHPGLHKLVHKAIMECSMDIRKEMSRSIFLAGGVTQLPGLVDRLTTEIDNLTPPAIRPKVHASPYRYHASYIGACVLAESPAFTQSRISSEDWNKHGSAALRKWSL